MSAPTIAGPRPVIGWQAQRPEWLAARRHGLGASDVAAVLGFSHYTTPWQVWAEKTDTRRPEDLPSAAAELGIALEPWLLEQAAVLLGQPVVRTDHQLYAHPQHAWRLCSPDGTTLTGPLVQCKTGGLASGWGTPRGWEDDGTPLGYELQTRWEMHVMDRPRVEIIALIAGLGLIRRTIVRDLSIESDLVAQVSDWYERHIIGGVEPPLGGTDNEALAALYPRSDGTVVDLDGTNALELWSAYRDAHGREKAAKSDKEAAGAGLKALMRDHQYGRLDGHLLCTWGEKQGAVDWPRLVADLAETAGVPVPSPDNYRKPATRSLSVKDMT